MHPKTQVGRVTFHTRPDRSCLVIYPQRPWWETIPSVSWYLRTGTVLIHNEIWPDSVSWCDCSPHLSELIADQHDITHVSCFTINPRGRHEHPVNIATIAFKWQDLPDSVYIGGAFYRIKPYFPPLLQCQNCWRFRHPAKYCRSTARCPLCASPGHTCTNCLQQYTSVKTTQEHNIFF